MSSLPKPVNKKTDHAPPVIRRQPTLSTLDAIKTIPFHRFKYNSKFADLQPLVLLSSGSFSPISTLHIQLLAMIRENIMIKHRYGHVIAGLLSPVHDDYGKKSLVPQQHRYKMCQLACNDPGYNNDNDNTHPHIDIDHDDADDVNWIGVTDLELKQDYWIETRLAFDQLNDAMNIAFQHDDKDTNTIIPTPPITLPKQLHSLTTTPRIVFCMGSDVFLGFANPAWWSDEDIEVFCTRYHIAIILRESDAVQVEELLETHPIVSKYWNAQQKTDSDARANNKINDDANDPDNNNHDHNNNNNNNNNKDKKVIYSNNTTVPPILIIPSTFTNSISSTLIRNQISCGGSIYGLVHPSVNKYIKQHTLYSSNSNVVHGHAASDGGEYNYTPLFENQ